MYVLFSLTALCFWGFACEQRPELGKSVEFTSQSTKEVSITSLEKTITENRDVAKDKSDKNENVESDKNEETVNIDQENPSQEPDPFDEEPFQLDSSEMGQEVTEVTEVIEDETKSEATASNMETVDVTSLDLVGGWPVQVIGILSESFPKRAVLRRANGAEISVQAGQFISEEKLVVLAIGRNHVSLAKIHPDGNVATIQQMDLQPLD